MFTLIGYGKNDIIIIDNIISEKYISGFPSIGDAFEYFSTEQILKDYDLTKQEILDGLVCASPSISFFNKSKPAFFIKLTEKQNELHDLRFD